MKLGFLNLTDLSQRLVEDITNQEKHPEKLCAKELTESTSTDWKTGKEISGTIEEETRITIENIRKVLEAAGSSLRDVIKATVYLTNFDEDFGRYNKVWASYFKDSLPARATIGVSKLYGKCKIEVDVVALNKEETEPEKAVIL